MNILITSIGSYSAKFVIEQSHLCNAYIIGVDINDAKYLINAKLADKFYKVPLTLNTDLYLDEVSKIIERCNVTHIIPLTDVDVDFFSLYLEYFINLGTKVLVEKYELINLMRNKKNMFAYFSKQQSIQCIPTYTKEEYFAKCNIYPAIAKIINGRSSQNLLTIGSPEQLNFIPEDNYIIQPKITGDIITVDVINYNGISCWIQRKEIFRSSNGVGITIEIINNQSINQSIESIIKSTNYVGIFNAEFILHNDKVFLMDINPRFSAGVAFSFHAGYNFVMNALNLMNNTNIEPQVLSIPVGKVIVKEFQEKII